LIERRLVDVGDRLKQLRRDLRVAEEQLAHFAGEADDARLRSLVSETPLAEREHREAQRHADAVARDRLRLQEEIDRLEALQDELLDRLTSGAPDAPTTATEELR
jgi:chromosome segregation ATPase